ncbi:arginase family protein [Solirubrobacter sp. CPCC 204708]|uniref:Arginase family protein n=1 Tax=Solirubrobacter deserti TaxID=2282478 RepID=A0ABT4RTW7_9ACTN|nr:arginase family protein [Solirubrobacter deserti]MBE2318676.1 arginase family protein [Solirubrobacter deserti]MDA0142013.1 arginase family protein [Solirubrobacter deserti]
MPHRGWTVLDAPSNLGLRQLRPGVEPGARRLADALRACGLVERLGGRDAGRVEAPPWTSLPENRAKIPAYTVALADRLGELLRAGEKPLVLGGDCSILLGAMLALRRHGHYGLAFVDGHLDFRTENVDAVAGEDLAVVTGRAEDALADIDGLRPYVRDEDVVAYGDRSGDRAPVRVIDLAALRAGEWAVPDVPYWVHVDADVLRLDAVDSPQPDGLSYDELADVVRRLLPGAVGMQVTIFDPDLDPDGSAAAALTDCLVRGALP